jgi:hypothetical protein
MVCRARPRIERVATADLSRIQSGDILLWRPTTLCGRIIAACGRSVYSHAGMAAVLGSDLISLDMLQFRGGKAELLSGYVAAHPGRIDWYQARDAIGAPDATPLWYDRHGAVGRMWDFVGHRYGWRAIGLVSLRHLPIVRLFCPVPSDGEHSHLPAFCSGAVSIACYEGGGVDPCPNLAHRLTEPGDLARSLLFRYRATLYTPETLPEE